MDSAALLPQVDYPCQKVFSSPPSPNPKRLCFSVLHQHHTVHHVAMSIRSSPTLAEAVFTKSMMWLPQAMVATVNNLLQPQAQGAWRELSTGEQLRAATMLLDTVEQGAFVLADNLLKTDIVQENTDNIREYSSRTSFKYPLRRVFKINLIDPPSREIWSLP